jgi:hypothetical protein
VRTSVYAKTVISECSSARLERLVWDQKAVRSIRTTPTNYSGEASMFRFTCNYGPFYEHQEYPVISRFYDGVIVKKNGKPWHVPSYAGYVE